MTHGYHLLIDTLTPLTNPTTRDKLMTATEKTRFFNCAFSPTVILLFSWGKSVLGLMIFHHTRIVFDH